MTSLIHQLISFSAQRYPHAIALQINTNQLSYAQLDKEVKAVAQGFLSLGVNQGDRRANCSSA
ncbi:MULTISPECIES: AMP-binding protein [Colwellia]|uniref:Non-ribosomal peptide synthetase n=1 Tax=Colwellia marinimaniae TaxID=1513592 RepID=A0ABQ0MQD1_9GAMM|nr:MULTISPECIES: AMP-binding protein [Colwellia]GAW94578.1 non-ribosomal peptide synthetase [Colwellia marinimaniae]